MWLADWLQSFYMNKNEFCPECGWLGAGGKENMRYQPALFACCGSRDE